MPIKHVQLSSLQMVCQIFPFRSQNERSQLALSHCRLIGVVLFLLWSVCVWGGKKERKKERRDAFFPVVLLFCAFLCLPNGFVAPVCCQMRATASGGQGAEFLSVSNVPEVALNADLTAPRNEAELMESIQHVQPRETDIIRRGIWASKENRIEFDWDSMFQDGEECRMLQRGERVTDTDTGREKLTVYVKDRMYEIAAISWKHAPSFQKLEVILAHSKQARQAFGVPDSDLVCTFMWFFKVVVFQRRLFRRSRPIKLMIPNS